MDALIQDLRYAVRKLWHQPAFSAAVIGVIALGIGAATAMFSAVDAALLRPLPFHRDAELMALRSVGIPFEQIERQTQPYLADVRELAVFSHVGAYAPGGMNLGTADAAMRVNMATASSDLFETLGVLPALGRPFTSAEEAPRGPRVAILSHGIWRRHFGGDRGALGRDVLLNSRPYEIVGVMPPGFTFPEGAQVWIPMRMPFGWADFEPFRGWMPSQVVGRLAPGLTRERAGAEMLALARRFAPPEHPVTLTAAELVSPLRELLVGKRRTALLILLGATGVVLLVACANAANLLLARATARRGEIALRSAIGGSRARIVRQLLAESVVLALCGAVGGVILAFTAFDALRVLLPDALSALAEPRLDLRVLGFAVALALATGLAFGLWPAVSATRTQPAEVIKSGAQGTGRQGVLARRIFVVAELGLAMMLVVGSGLMLRSLQSVLSTDPGIEAEHVATLELSLSAATYGTVEARRSFTRRTLERLEAIPGIQAAAFINELPLRGKGSISVGLKPEGGEAPTRSEQWPQLLYVTPDYFRALGIPLLAGRGFRQWEGGDRPNEIVISAEMARVYWPDQDPLGKRVEMMGDELLTVVGVVGNVLPVALDQPLRPQMYQLMTEASGNVALVARGNIPARALAARLRDAVASVDPAQAVYNVRPMRDVIAGAIAVRRANTLLIALFGGIAVALAAVGVYGVLAYGVARRTRELGIRMALGARSGDVVRLVVGEGLLLAAIGIALGLAGAWAFRRVMESLLYGIVPSDPATFLVAPVVLLLAAALAMMLPARRATRVNPMEAIRVE